MVLYSTCSALDAIKGSVKQSNCFATLPCVKSLVNRFIAICFASYRLLFLIFYQARLGMSMLPIFTACVKVTNRLQSHCLRETILKRRSARCSFSTATPTAATTAAPSGRFSARFVASAANTICAALLLCRAVSLYKKTGFQITETLFGYLY